MHAATPALIVAALATACVWSGFLWQLWVLRHAFEIAARAPVIVGICGAAGLAVLLTVFVHWILLLEGNGVPCYVMLVASYFCMAACMFPYCLRALQLVVAYNTRYRLKYARYVKGKHILKMSAAMGTGIAVITLLVFIYMPERYGRDKYGCFFFNERRATELTLVLGVGPTIFAVFQLMNVRDVFGIGPEILRVILPILLGVVTQMTVQELLHYAILEDTRIVHFFMELIILVCVSNMIFWSALIPVARYYGWHGAGKMYVLPVEDPTSQSIDTKEGVYDYAREGGEVAEAFGGFCRKNLCMESWDFIRDSTAYKIQTLTNPQEQFTSFICIVDRYLRPTSPQEVNLGSSIQARLKPFQTKSTFTSLNEATRSAILEAAVSEIVLMLEQNILAKFKATPEMKQREQRKLVEIEINSAHAVADGDQGILELMTSVSLGKMGSPRSYFESGRQSGQIASRKTSAASESSYPYVSRGS